MSDLPATFVKGFHDEAALRKMKYNKLGNTGLEISQISLGGAAFASFYEKFEEEDAIKTIQEAIRRGINYIDTAPYYGQGRSETILGKALKGVPREAYYIATKIGRYETDFENMFDFTKGKTEASFNKSLSLLGLDYVDVLQVHDVEFANSLDIVLSEAIPTVNKIKQSGRAKFIGVTGYPLSVLHEVIQKTDVKLDLVLSYARNNLFDTALTKYIPKFQEKGLGIICAADHAMGLLTNNGPQPWHPANQTIKDKCAEASKYCKDKGVELGKLALSHSMTRPGIATHLIGINCMRVLEFNLAVSMNNLTDVENTVLEEVKKILEPIKDLNWEGFEVERYKNYMKSVK